MAKIPEETLEGVVSSLRKKYSDNHFSFLDEHRDIKRIPSDIPSINWALGGGLPCGRLVEIYGQESSGKSALAMHFAGMAQKIGKIVCYIDAEFGFDGNHARGLGVKTDRNSFVLVHPHHGEETGEIILKMLDIKDMGLIVIDSVPSLCPRSEMEGEIGDSHVGHIPRLMSQMMRMIVPKLGATDCSIVFINQIREKIGVMFGNPETTPGGRALKFYSSVRCQTKKRASIKDPDNEGQFKGITTEMYVVKNKTAPPFRKIEYDLIFGEGFDKVADLFKLALSQGIIVAKGAWVYLATKDGQEQLAQGREKTIALMKSNKELFDSISEKLAF